MKQILSLGKVALLGHTLWVGSTVCAQGPTGTAQYRLHATLIQCRVAPCADWEVTNQLTGERFEAVVQLGQAGGALPQAALDGTLDILADADRINIDRPGTGMTFPMLRVIRVLGTVAVEAAAAERR